jgi:hypothetical protein
MKLTEQQALSVIMAVGVARGEVRAEDVQAHLDMARPDEKQQALAMVREVLTAAITQGLVVEAAPVKPFVDLRQL